MPIATIIVAAGEGRRLGADGPKAFVPLAGRALFLHSVERLAALPDLVEQILVVPAGAVARVRAEWGDDLRRWKVTRVVEGGARRQDSAAAGFAALGPDADVVLVHDAARPLVTAERAAAVAAAAARDGGALLAVPLADTLKRDGGDGIVADTLPRTGLWCAQTPQGFRRAVYAAALERAAADGTEATDDASLVERAGGRVRLVPGDPANLKVTTREDLRLAEARLAGEDR